MCVVVYRYQAGWEAYVATLNVMVDKQARTRTAKASSQSGDQTQQKRRRFNNEIPDISVEVNVNDDAPSLVSQLEETVFSTINPISEHMGNFMENLGFSKHDISPFCQREFTSSASRFF